MHAIFTSASAGAHRLAASCAATAALAGLAGCDGPRHAPPPLPLTVTATDANGPLVKGQNAVFTFTLTNPSTSDVPDVELITTSRQLDATSIALLHTADVTCAAQHATCPAVSSAGITDPFTLPAGGALTFTVTTLVTYDYAGQATQRFEAFAMERSGAVTVDAHATLADAREGYYELFTASGLRTNLDVRLQAGATKFALSSGTLESTFVEHYGGYVFPSGLVFKTGPDLLVGQANFGNGAETFIGARILVDTLSDLDGRAFTVVGVDHPGGTAAASSVRAMAISGSTLTACVDAAPHAIATCPAGSLRQYALTHNATIFTATDAADRDEFNFQVARSAGDLILLQADKSSAGGVFAVGLADAAVGANDLYAIGAIGGVQDALALKPDSFSISPIDLEARVVSQGTTAALVTPAGGPAGLVAGVRPSDGAALLMVRQAGLLLVSGPAGEFDALIDATLR